MTDNFLVELENHWLLFSGICMAAYLVARVSFGAGRKSRDVVTEDYLAKYCKKMMESCHGEIQPSIDQAKRDSINIHDLVNLVKSTRAALEDTIKYRKHILRGVALINKQSIRLRSSVANTHTILGYMSDRLWGDDEEKLTMVKDILKKEQVENKNYIGTFMEDFGEEA
jgi:hypothetical protein